MNTLRTLNKACQEVVVALFDVQEYLIQHYEDLKGLLVRISFFGGDIVFDVDSIYQDYLRKKSVDK